MYMMAKSTLVMAHAQWKPSERAIIILQDRCPNVSKERLTIKDLRFVVKALKTLSSRWEGIGMTANIIDLDQIKIEHRGLYKRLIAVVNTWLSGNYNEEGDGSNAPSWWKIVDIVADDIGGANPNLAHFIAKNWKELGKDQFSTLAQSSSKTPLSCGMDGSKKLITIIVKALNGVASKWFEIAVLFGIPVNKLNSIKQDCDCSTEACLKEMITEWLSGRYKEASGYPTPSVCVLVDAVEHQVGGSNPALAKELTMLTFDAPNPTMDSMIAPSGLQGNSSQLHQSDQTHNAVKQTSVKRDETAGLNPTATKSTDAQLVKDFPAISPGAGLPGAATIQPEVPKYSLEHDAFEEALPRPPDGSPELKALQKFAAEVVIILHTTVSPSEMPAVLKDMTAPELGLQLDGPINLLSVPNTIILGMFGGYKCAIVQTEQGQKCKKEIESALDKHLQNTRFVIALGMAYSIPKYKFGDVLVSKNIRGVFNPRMEEACIKPRSSEYFCVPVSGYLSKTFGRNLDNWHDFECSNTGRISRVYAGDIVSVPWLVADETTRDKLLVNFPDAIGGEMEGLELLQIQKDFQPRKLGVIIIKGAADHADKDKKAGKLWQYTAARAAVCFTKFKLERTNGSLFADVPEA